MSELSAQAIAHVLWLRGALSPDCPLCREFLEAERKLAGIVLDSAIDD